MIIDLPKFIAAERPYWNKLEAALNQLEASPNWRLPLSELREFHYLYERASADLGKINTFASEPELRRYLENLVARAYTEIHETRERQHRFSLSDWFFKTFPQTFRRQVNAFYLALAITFGGCCFGGLVTVLDPDSRYATMPFGHDQLRPRERVAQEEKAKTDRYAGQRGGFSSYLMTHNTQVSIFTLALGMTYGVGTILMLFYNGIALGAISLDYILDGQSLFLCGWILPHGSIELPAILIAGQAGLVLAGALIGRGRREALPTRVRLIAGDLTTLIGGVATLLIWAGFVEGFLSQYHEPVIPYWLKISFGLVELALLVAFLSKSGAGILTPQSPAAGPTPQANR
ncbi:MAG: stage II sporulation protein M, partial [Verrucomicrobiota bacterium]